MQMNISQSSGLLTADGVISAESCYLCSIMAGADNTNAGTILLYDNASAASGTVVAKIVVDAGTTNANMTFDSPVQCNNGLYLDIGGTGAEVVVHFTKQ